MPPFLNIIGDVVAPVRPAPIPGPGPEAKDCSKSKSWSKSRGHKKHGKKDC